MEMRAISYASSHASGVTLLKAESGSSSAAISALHFSALRTQHSALFLMPFPLTPHNLPLTLFLARLAQSLQEIQVSRKGAMGAMGDHQHNNSGLYSFTLRILSVLGGFA